MADLKHMAVRALKEKQAILFGCDVLQESSRKLGVLDKGVLAYDLLFGTPFEMDRAQRMQFLQSTLTHDMVLLWVDLVDERPVKWKVENSWGDEVGRKGIFQMSDAWFDEHVYCIVVHRSYLSQEQAAQLAQPPTALPAWHPLAWPSARQARAGRLLERGLCELAGWGGRGPILAPATCGPQSPG